MTSLKERKEKPMKKICKKLLSVVLCISMISSPLLSYAETYTSSTTNGIRTEVNGKAAASEPTTGGESIFDKDDPVMRSTFQTWCYTQLYGRLFNTAGSMLISMAKNCSDNEVFQDSVSFVNKLVFGGNDMGSDIAEIKEMCAQILSEINEMEAYLESSHNDISSALADQNMQSVYTNYENAWKNDVEKPMQSSAAPNYRGVHDAFKEYMKYAESYANGTVLDELGRAATQNEANAKREFLFETFTYMSSDVYKSTETTLSREEFYKSSMFLSDEIDKQIISVLSDLLKNMYNSSNADNKMRYIDTAAQVAYYSLQYSSQQAEFVDYAAQRQLNELCTVVMVYQEFQAMRAEYFEELCEEQKTKVDAEALEDYTASLNKFYVESRNMIAPYFSGTATNGGIKGVLDKWLNGKIYLEGKLDGSYIYLDSYAREQSNSDLTLRFKDGSYLTKTDWKFYVEESKKGNLDQILENYYDGGVTDVDGGSEPNFVGKKNTFAREAVIIPSSSSGEEASLVPLYLLTADSLGKENFYLKKFDYNYEDIFGFNDCHVPSADYYNLVRGEYTDGLNTFKCLSSPTQLQSVITNNYYAVLQNKPFSYLAPLMTNNLYGENPVFLLMDTATGMSSKSFTYYSIFNALDISKDISYAASGNWTLSSINQYNLQDDRKESEKNTNYMYAVMLMGTNENYRSKIQTSIVGKSEYKVSYEAANPYSAEDVNIKNAGSDETITANAGTSVTVTVELPEGHPITEVRAQYYEDAEMTELIDEVEIIGTSSTNYIEYGENGKAQLHLRVPYAHVKLIFNTECSEFVNGMCPVCGACEAPSVTTIDGKEYYEISNAGNLYWFAYLVNGDRTHADFNKQNTAANAILRDNISLEDIKFYWPGVGYNGEIYTGTFDGDGYGISGLNNIDKPYDLAGLFYLVGAEGKVQNLIVDNAHVFGPSGEGSAVIASANYGTIQNILVRNSLVETIVIAENLGGIVGVNHEGGLITNCAFVNSELRRSFDLLTLGGICEKNDGTVSFTHTYQSKFGFGETDKNGAIISQQGASGKSSMNFYYTDSEVADTYGKARTKEDFNNKSVLNDFVNSPEYKGNWYQDDDMDYPVPIKEKFNNCKVTYVLNGGENADNPTIVAKGETVKLKDPVKTGYDFDGWYLDAEFKNKCDSIVGNQKEVTLYAKWGDFTTYKITYDLNGGTNAKTNPSTYTMNSDDITLADASKERCKFTGWYTDKECTKQITSIPKGSYGNLVLYAGWEIVPYLEKEGDNYVISSYEDLLSLAALLESEPEKYAGANYVQTQSIVCGMGQWKQSIGSETHPFTGTYDGQGNCIIGLRPTENVSGLFGVIGAEGYVKNLYVADFDYEKPAEYAGGLAGFNYGIIDSCGSGLNIKINIYVERENGEKVLISEMNSKICGKKAAGGLVAINEGVIKNSRSSADVVVEASGEEDTFAGGIAGKNTGTIKNIFHTGTVTGGTYAGGIAGQHSSSTSDVESIIQFGYNAGTVKGTHSGGIVGLCKNTNVKDMYYAATNEAATYSLDDASLKVKKMELGDMKKDAFVDELNSLIAGTDFATWIIDAKYNDGYPKFEHDNSESQLISSINQGLFKPGQDKDDKDNKDNSNSGNSNNGILVDTGDDTSITLWIVLAALSLAVMVVMAVAILKGKKKE